MRELALHNNSTADIKDYPIAEAVLDKEGNPKIDPDTQQPVTTGDTYTWDLAAGETKVFPEYVARYLVSIYGFLEEVEVSEEVVEDSEEVSEDTPEVEKPTRDSSDFRCKYCEDYEAASMRGLGLHVAAKHPDKL